MCKFNTYGAAIDSLIEHLRPLLKERVVLSRSHLIFGTFQRFDAETTLLVHRSFQSWATDNEFQNLAMLRDELHKHVKSSGNGRWFVALERLFKYLPHEFNVRGKWTPEELPGDYQCDFIVDRQRER